jgi:hypothetical protein
VLTSKIRCYLEVLTRLSVRRKRPKLWPDKWILHHNALTRNVLKVSRVPG